MTRTLPPLRPELDIFPSPDPDQPGFVLRDPFQYTDVIAIVPPVLATILPYFDGEHTELDIQTYLTRITGEVDLGEVVKGFVDSLGSAGFLLSEEFEAMRVAAHEEFAREPERLPAHSGTGYPDDPDELRDRLREYMAGARRLDGGASRLVGLSGSLADPTEPRRTAPASGLVDPFGAPLPSTLPSAAPERPSDLAGLRGIAAPHVSPEGGWKSYAAAYGALGPHLADRTFVILGTSHYGPPERFGLTRKGFRTPLGLAPCDVDLVDALVKEAPDSIEMEDYCHAIEHSIEFQVVFLQHLVGPNVRVLPILCGPFHEALLGGGRPESNSAVGAFFDALGRAAEARGRDLFWILGVDLAHVGLRYGDSLEAQAEQGAMKEVRARDLARLDRISKADDGGLLELVLPNHDDLKWCGFSPLYTFLRVMPGLVGDVWHYEQWNIDDQSVVSFAALGFQDTGGIV